MAEAIGSLNPTADQNWAAYLRCRESGHDDYVRVAKRCDAYYNGEQWDESVKTSLEAVKRPALTINAIMPVVNALIGEQINQRAEITLRPKRHTTMELAEVQTRLLHHILETNRYRYQETQIFTDGIIQDRGFFNIYLDFADHIQGEVRIETLDPLDVLIDPDAKDSDPATWSQVIITRWLTLDDVAVLYGKDKAVALDGLAGADRTYGSDSVLTGESNTFGDSETAVLYTPAVQENDPWSIRRVRIIDRQYRKLERVKFFVDPRTGDMREVPGSWSQDRVDQFMAQFGLGILDKLARKVRWTITADQVVLHDDWSPYEQFTVVPYFPIFRRGQPSGIVKHLLDPQDQYNKISSQELHVVNTTANSGWIVEAGSLVNMDETDLEARGAETGLVLTLRPGAPPPVKIQPNPIPTGLDRLAAKAKADLREVSGIEALPGQESPEVSGVAIQAKQQRALTITQVPMDNLNVTRQLVAQRILALVQRFYTEPRVYYITLWDQPKQPGADLEVNQIDPAGQVVNDLTVGEYEVSVAIVPSRDTFDDVQFAEVVQLRQAGVLIPDDIVIEYSHLSRRDDIAERVRKMMGAGEPSPEEVQVLQQKMQMEMEKAQAELEEMKAKAMNLAAQAALAQAKAEATTQQAEGYATVEGAKRQLEHQRLQMEILGQLATLQNKLDVAKLHTTAKVLTTQVNNQAAAELEKLKATLAPKTNKPL